MGELLNIIEKNSGGKCFCVNRCCLDHIQFHEYQDNDEEFKSDRIFETDNNGKNIKLDIFQSKYSLFKYFLDGSRRTYRVADFATTDNKFLPIVAGQLGTAVCFRENGRIYKHKLLRSNVLALPDRLGGEYEKIQKDISKKTIHNLKVDRIVKYQYKPNPERPFENLAIAKIQLEMLTMEVELIHEIANSNKLDTGNMLMIDGSLQFSSIKEDNEYIMQNVVGISKSFNPHLQGILKTKTKEIGHHLLNLQFAERSPVYKYLAKNMINTTVGAWYLRIRQTKYSESPLNGIIKIEKIATTKHEKEYGFDTEVINEISRALLLERNVTCYGVDDRWANHLYPIFLTETFLKNSFVSDQYFLNIF
jgi:hypothetical protein